MIMASFATEDESVSDLFVQPNFWRSSLLLDSPTPIAKDFFDLSNTSEWLNGGLCLTQHLTVTRQN